MLGHWGSQLGAIRASGKQQSSLGDQDLLSEVLQSKHVDTYVMFPSWWNHGDIAGRRVPEIMKTLGLSHSWAVTPHMIDDFVQKFGAVHFSRAFSISEAGVSSQTKRSALLAASRVTEATVLTR